MLNEKLISNALALSGKTMADMEIILPRTMLPKRFSIEKFCYYLLSPSFISNYYCIILCGESEVAGEPLREYCTTAMKLGEAIYEYQLGQELFSQGKISEKERDEYEKPLTNLLSKI